MVAAIAVTVASSALAAPKYKVLHAFAAGRGGGGLWGSLALDSKGNLYGTTSGGGDYGYGTVFELMQHPDGKWTHSVLHSFENDGPDGADPTGGLILDAAGNLYGTTTFGGAYYYGSVFEMVRQSSGWKETVLHSFEFNSHGCCPYAGVAMDEAGNLFGTASVAFKLSPGADGWKETVLHDFTGESGDGEEPIAGLILDAAGNVYGTTQHGGGSSNCGGGCGTAYQLSPSSKGKWKETVLHRFQARQDGAFPGVGALAIDSASNLYGTTDAGTIFELSPGVEGRWKFAVLYTITGGSNGTEPSAGVVLDKAGNLYGTTIAGGSPQCDCGVVYKLAPGSKGKWNYAVLHTFVGSDGAQPDANLILDSEGNLYGTTATGGAGGYGVAFELTP